MQVVLVGPKERWTNGKGNELEGLRQGYFLRTADAVPVACLLNLGECVTKGNAMLHDGGEEATL